MKCFDSMSGKFWGHKVNFVDENNVFVGYDMEQNCCEHADWFVSADKDEQYSYDKHMNNTFNFDGWYFDPSFFHKPDNGTHLDGGDHVTFRMVRGDEEMFLHIFNSHNGYYGHGFQFGIVDGEIIEEGTL